MPDLAHRASSGDDTDLEEPETFQDWSQEDDNNEGMLMDVPVTELEGFDEDVPSVILLSLS